MTKILFIPFSILAGLVSGLLSRRIFGAVWGVIDEEQPPQAEHRRVSWGKLALALGLEGAVFRLVKGLVDHGSREGFSRLTGSWPGAEEPEPE
ncbi:MAG TPA: DUF4235 domain-containing protein [Solirubrobacteraceae bacterium]